MGGKMFRSQGPYKLIPKIDIKTIKETRYYLRMTGDNRYSGCGTKNWVRIIKLENGIAYIGDPKDKVGMDISGPTNPNVEFRKGFWPETEPCGNPYHEGIKI